MCLITFAPNGSKTLDWHTLDYSHKYMNKDGWGIAVYVDGEWLVNKSLRNMGVLKRAIGRFPDDAPIVVHQRYATHGAVTLENLHPFAAAKGVLVMHNGTISGTRADHGAWAKNEKGSWMRSKEDISDTRAYVEDELSPLIVAAGTKWLRHAAALRALENRIGSGSVVTILLPNDPTPVIVNEDRGAWENGIYYSNDYARPDKEQAPWWRGSYDMSAWEDIDGRPLRSDYATREAVSAATRAIGFRAGAAAAEEPKEEKRAKGCEIIHLPAPELFRAVIEEEEIEEAEAEEYRHESDLDWLPPAEHYEDEEFAEWLAKERDEYQRRKMAGAE